MRSAQVLALSFMTAVLALGGCSDSSEVEADLLEGVESSSAASLCAEFATIRVSFDASRNLLRSPEIAQVAAGYEGLATKARNAKASALGETLSKAAQAADALSKAAQSPAQMPQAALMTRVLRLQYHETAIRLACAERGYAT